MHMKPILNFCNELLTLESEITAENMLHQLHVAGYETKAAILAIKQCYQQLTVDSLFQLVLNEYTNAIISKKEIEELLSACGASNSVETAESKSLGFVMMLDVSGSMGYWISRVKIDAKAFVRQSRIGDQFGINTFSDNAKWIYPEGDDPDIITVNSLDDTKKAIRPIENIHVLELTNIGEAISFGNKMIEKSTADIKAFVLLSDGYWNCGQDPVGILKPEPPIFIAALGNYVRREHFQKLIDKNEKSDYYQTPNVAGMMRMFNQIINDISNSSLSLNEEEELPKGSDFIVKRFNLSKIGGSVTANVVWDNEIFQYTEGMLEYNLANVYFVNPKGDSVYIKPDVADPGYCIFRFKNTMLGNWAVVIEYTSHDKMECTIGVMEDTTINTEIIAPIDISVDAIIPIRVNVWDNGVPLTDCSIEANVKSPIKEIQLPLRSAAEETCLIPLFSEQKCSTLSFVPTNNGSFYSEFCDTRIRGVYNIEFTIKGKCIDTGAEFTTIKRKSVFVE